jgi:hypothetical protein
MANAKCQNGEWQMARRFDVRVMWLAAAIVWASGAQSVPVAPAVPVVVELFTSEGCSSCPPADDLLTALAKEQPIAGARVIPLGMHVTYWDDLGWKDPASLKGATDRQQRYGANWGTDRIYTPQAVVDGREEIVASDAGGLKRAIAKAAKQPHARVDVAATADGASLIAQVTVTDLPADAKEPMEVRVVLTENGLTSIVKRGENGGRTLHHDAVVRQLLEPAAASGPGPLTFHAALRPEWRRDQMNVVAILQGKKTQRIWGAATTALK